jgi:hypothetical protein
MTAVPIRIAEAVTAELVSAVAADAFTLAGWSPRRSYADWDEEWEDLKDLAVDVVFVSIGTDNRVDLDSASTLEYRQAIHIALRKRFGSADRDGDGRLLNESIDPLVELLEQIHEHFVRLRLGAALPTEPLANWDMSEAVQWVNQDLLRRGLFQGVVALTFRVPSEVGP